MRCVCAPALSLNTNSPSTVFLGQPRDIMDTFNGSPSTGGGIRVGAGAAAFLGGAAVPPPPPKPFASGGGGPRRLDRCGPAGAPADPRQEQAARADWLAARPLEQAAAQEDVRSAGIVSCVVAGPGGMRRVSARDERRAPGAKLAGLAFFTSTLAAVRAGFFCDRNRPRA